jgi:hypothetical protein
VSRCRCLSPGDGYGRCPGPESCPLCQPEDDFDPASAAELIPLAWLESMADASPGDDEKPRELGWVPGRLSGGADQMHARILDCKNGYWLLTLALNHPEWAEPAMRQLAAMCKDSPTWARWLQHCQDQHDEQLEAA